MYGCSITLQYRIVALQALDQKKRNFELSAAHFLSKLCMPEIMLLEDHLKGSLPPCEGSRKTRKQWFYPQKTAPTVLR